MAADMDSSSSSDAYVGSKRTIAEMEGTAFAFHLHHQKQQEGQPQPSSASPRSVPAPVESKELSLVVSSSVNDSQQPLQENLSPGFFKKVECSFTESESCRQELGFEENRGILGSVAEGKATLCDLVSGSFGSESNSEGFEGKIESFGVQLQETENSVVGFASEDKEKGGQIEEIVNDLKEEGKSNDCTEVESGFFGIQEVGKKEVSGEYETNEEVRSSAIDENNESLKVIHESETESLLEAKKKKLLAELEDGLIFKDERHVETVVETNSGILAALKGIDGSVRRSLQIEVIDDTALIGPVSVPKSSNHSVNVAERTGKKNEKQETDVKGKRPRRRGKNAKKVLETGESKKKTSQVGEARNNGRISGDQMKRKYSREELEALRFGNVVEQRKTWRNIYTGLSHSVAKEYDDLSSSRYQKNIHLNFDPQWDHGKKADCPGILGEVCSEIVENELETVEENKLEHMDFLDPACCHSVGGARGSGVLEGEYSEEDDSDEEYDSILRPAFLVEGEPDFDSGPPEDGLEYLRRVRWEAAHFPKVAVAKLDSSKAKMEQSVYMPQIPEIAKCPENLMPSKQWEDAFLADFSKLRLYLLQNDGSGGKFSPGQQSTVTLPEADISFQLSESNVLEKFSKLGTDEVNSYAPAEEGDSNGQPPLLNTEEGENFASSQNATSRSSDSDGSCTYPALSAILAMDSVARVLALRKRISLAETVGTLSKNDCVWLFALCAAVDTPLNADTCAALRSLLRKCASLRAGKSELDDEVVMLNILATISGKYFGQSEI